MSNLLKALLWRLIGYFAPGIEEFTVVDDDTPPPDDDTPPPDDDTPPPDDDTPPPRQLSRAQRDIIAMRERTQKAETALAAANAQLLQAQRPQQPTEEQVIWQQEEEALKNPQIDQWQRYSIQANRAARAATAEARNSRAYAEELADQSAFRALKAEKPKVFDTYKDRVESERARLLSQGVRVSRENILKHMIGEDMLSGKIKPSAAKPAGADRQPAARAPRSDIPLSGGRMTEAEKREKRLENVRI